MCRMGAGWRGVGEKVWNGGFRGVDGIGERGVVDGGIWGAASFVVCGGGGLGLGGHVWFSRRICVRLV